MKFLNLLFFTVIALSVNGQILLSKKVSSCDEMGDADLKVNRIYSKEVTHDTLIVKLSYVGNCCADHSLKHEFRSDTMYLQQNVDYGVSLERLISGNDTVYKEVEIECACICYYFETLKFSGISDTSITINWNNEVLPVSKNMYITLPDMSTFDPKAPKNQSNEFGQPIGLWEVRYPNSRKVHHLIYYGPSTENYSYVLWSKSFDKKGNVTTIGMGFGRELDSISYERLIQQSQQCWPDE